MRNVLFCLFLTITINGCGDLPEDSSSPDTGELEYVSLPVEMALVPGNLDSNLEFEQVEMPLAVTESYDLVPVQVGAFILDLNEHNPDYLRIEFTSDRIEWVGYSADTADIYGSQEECEEVEEYCESVIVGQGESGYFEIQNGYAGIQNAYCRFAEESYSYNVTAVVYDLYVWPYLQISNPVEIEISCLVSE
jgi:hypothetical protein